MWKRSFQGGVIGDEGFGGFVNELADSFEFATGFFRLALGVALEVVLPSRFGHPENVLFEVGVAVFKLFRDFLSGGSLCLQLGFEL